MLCDSVSDARDGELRGVLSRVCVVVEFARDLMKLDFQECSMGQAEMFIAQAVQLGVKQRAQFLRIGRSGESDAHAGRIAHPKKA
jgi:hypothetical protein